MFEKLTAIMPNQDYLISEKFSFEENSSKLKRIPISVKFVQIQRILELKDLLSKLKTVWSKGGRIMFLGPNTNDILIYKEYSAFGND